MARRGRPPARRGRGRPAPRPPIEDAFDPAAALDLGNLSLPAEAPNVPLTRVELRRRRDIFIVAVFTPVLLLTILAGGLIVSAQVAPAPAVVRARLATPTVLARPTSAPVVIQPIDPTRLNAGVVADAPPFEWPEVEEWKFAPSTGRPGVQAEYTPLIAATTLRRLVEAVNVTMIRHANAEQAATASGELAKSYPLRSKSVSVIGMPARIGYIADDSGLGLTTTHGIFRIHAEMTVNSPPILPSQRTELEDQLLHIGDHLARRAEETISGARRTGMEATLVHLRDHGTRRLPFGG